MTPEGYAVVSAIAGKQEINSKWTLVPVCPPLTPNSENLTAIWLNDDLA
jgi:hypothetical protein